jgi:hypothetical protein
MGPHGLGPDPRPVGLRPPRPGGPCLPRVAAAWGTGGCRAQGDYRVLAVGVAGDRVRYLGYTPRPDEALLPPPPGDGEDPVLALKTLAERGVRFRRQGDRLAVFPAVAADDLFPLLEAIVPLAVRYLDDGEEVPASVLLSRVLGGLQVPFAARA